MKRLYRKHRSFLMISVLFSCFSSAAILAIPYGIKKDADWVSIAISVVFWSGLILEQVFFWMANATLKKMLPAIQLRYRPKIGLISLFATGKGSIADIMFAVALIAFLILTISGIGKEIGQCITLFLLVLSFRLHCILNGKNFWYSNYLSRGEKNHG